MWWIVFTIFIQYQGRPPFIEFADAVKSMLMNYEIYSSIKNHAFSSLRKIYLNISSFHTSFTKSTSTAVLSVISFFPKET